MYDMKVCIKQRCIIEFFYVETILSINIHQLLLKIYYDQVVDINTDRFWVMHFRIGDNDVCEKLLFRCPCTDINLSVWIDDYDERAV